MEKRKLNNEGFSLIELIVVIAIMAILVGAMAPVITKYIDKAKKSNDIQALGTLYTAVQTALLDPSVTTKPASGSIVVAATTGVCSETDAKVTTTEVLDTMGLSAVGGLKFTSAGFVKNGTTITVSIDQSKGTVKIEVPMSDKSPATQKIVIDGSGEREETITTP